MGRRRLTDPAKLGATRPPRAASLNDSSCASAHNTPLPLERSPPASFKRLLGGNGPPGFTRQGLERCDRRAPRGIAGESRYGPIRPLIVDEGNQSPTITPMKSCEHLSRSRQTRLKDGPLLSSMRCRIRRRKGVDIGN